MHGPTHLQCPVCGHVFMAATSSQEGVQTCAHCAFIGPSPHFAIVAPSLGAAPIRFQKRAARGRPEDPTPTQAPLQPPPPEAARPLPAHLTQSGAQQRLHPPSHFSSPPYAEDELIAPTQHRPVLRWVFTGLTIIAIVAVVSLLAWEKIQLKIRLKAAEAAAALAKTSPVAQSTATAARTLPSQLESNLLTQDALPDAIRLTDILFTASTLEDRLQAIEDPEEHRQQVSQLFDSAETRPKLISVVPISRPPLSFLDQKRIAMFRIITSKNPGGALVWVMRSSDGRAVIHWPLFYDTHEKVMSHFLQNVTDRPGWFYVGLKRTHSFDLPEPQRTEHEVFDVDGSTDGTCRAHVFLPKKTPLARALAERIQWNEFYYGRVLLGWVDIGGTMRPAFLDCEGIKASNVTDPK